MKSTSIALLSSLLLPSVLSAQIIGGKWSKEHRFTGGNTWDMLGTAVSGGGDVDGDGIPDLLVGAPQMDTNGWTDNGVVFVYSGSTGAEIWKLEGTGNGVLFGTSVANADDVNGDGFADIIVGAPKASGNGFTEGGLVTVFSGIDGSALFSFEGNSANSKVGSCVSGAGDVNADGYADFILGGHQEDPNGMTDAGTAWVYSGRNGQLIHQFHGKNDWDWFGFNVSSAGDIDGDNHDDVMIAAIGTDPNGLQSAGTVYVYSGASGALLQQFDGDDLAGWYGWSLCALGDIDADGVNDLAIGSPWIELGGLTQAGLAQVFSGATGDEIMRFEGQVETGLFGNCISNANDVDGDGVDDVIVGAKWENPAGDLSGSAYIWSGADGSLIKRIDGGNPQDQLGCSVSGVGDLNGDGLNEILVGAMGKDPGGQESAGAALAYSLDPFVHLSQSTLSASQADSVQISLDFPDSEAGFRYSILASMHGKGPTHRGGIEIPLTADGLFQQMSAGWMPPVITNGKGVLNSTGNADVILEGHPTMVPLIGSNLFLAAVSIDQSLAIGSATSIARQIVITP